MNITGIEQVCKCRSFADGERCRFFRGWAPLMPGFKPGTPGGGMDPAVMPGGDAEEISLPDRLLNLRQPVHYVYAISGEDVAPYEHAIIGAFKVGDKGKETLVPYAWFSQSEEFIQGEEAFRRVGLPYEDDLEHGYMVALSVIEGAIHEYNSHWNHRMVLAYDDGTGLRCSGNDGALMDAIHVADKASREN